MSVFQTCSYASSLYPEPGYESCPGDYRKVDFPPMKFNDPPGLFDAICRSCAKKFVGPRNLYPAKDCEQKLWRLTMNVSEVEDEEEDSMLVPSLPMTAERLVWTVNALVGFTHLRNVTFKAERVDRPPVLYRTMSTPTHLLLSLDEFFVVGLGRADVRDVAWKETELPGEESYLGGSRRERLNIRECGIISALWHIGGVFHSPDIRILVLGYVNPLFMMEQFAPIYSTPPAAGSGTSKEAQQDHLADLLIARHPFRRDARLLVQKTEDLVRDIADKWNYRLLDDVEIPTTSKKLQQLKKDTKAAISDRVCREKELERAELTEPEQTAAEELERAADRSCKRKRGSKQDNGPPPYKRHMAYRSSSSS